MREFLVHLGLRSPTFAANAAKVATVPMCAVCAGYPLVVGPLMAAGVIGSGAFLHLAIPLLMPVNLWLLRMSFREHGKPLGLVLTLASVPFILAHMSGHFFLGGDEAILLGLIWIGGGLLVAGIMADWQAQRLVGRLSCALPDAYWRAVLTGEHPGLRRGRRLFGRLPAGARCKLCNAPLAGPFRLAMRLIGKAPSNKNPRFCGDCLTKTPVGGAEIELSLLFADVRGSTALAEGMSAAEFSRMMNRFYVAATDVLIPADALVDKFVGDEVVALFVPGFAGPDHAGRAIRAAEDLLRATGHADPDGPWLPVGVGVHTGIAFVGLVGSEGGVTDVTALGDAVNSAARLASAAAAGEVLVSEASGAAAGLALDDLERRRVALKGRSEPMCVRVLRVAPGRPVTAMPA